MWYRQFAVAILCAATLLAVAPSAHAQGLNGQDVHVWFLTPDKNTVLDEWFTETVTPSGATFPVLDGGTLTTVYPNFLTFNAPGFDGDYFTPAAFTGFRVGEVGASPVTIASVTVNPGTYWPGFDASRVSFDANNIFVNMQGLTIQEDYVVSLDIATAAVPEPGVVAFGVMAAGSVLGLVARKRKA